MTRVLFGMLKILIALVASLLAFVAGSLVLGGYVPAIPKAGLIGPVLTGQYPLHVALIGLAGLLLGLLALRLGLRRWGRVLTVVTSVSTAGAVIVAGLQAKAAYEAGTDVQWAEMFTQIAYPGVKPDVTETFAGDLQADVYLPRGASARTPAIVLAHAGGFHTFDRGDLRGTGRWLADHGVAAIAVDYRLSAPGAPTWGEAPQDFVCALAWTRANAARFNLDVDRLSMGGMSAGGGLALNAAYRLRAGEITSSCGDVPPPPASVVGFYPVTDVSEMWTRNIDGSRNAAVLYTGGSPAEFPGRYREVSPKTFVRPGLMPTLLVVGDRDRSARPQDVTAFARLLEDNGVPVTTEILPFAEHAPDDAYGSLPAQHSRQLLLDFLS
ncbi:alpha/beta hydrolase [Herbidospora yilanensis]|uniref:alpha/beta hydrolase n=1 Tax=Herbidospora yilanensis TaxID=354426 RepID=UPI0009FEBBAC|nr:alpha/beta hydrolase [Herbidospora yilanensis]